nr:MAG TPA_asm: tail tape measure protein [Caudoviricetes sp.]
MADQTIATQLTLNASQFVSEAGRAAQAAEKVTAASQKGTTTAATGWQALTQKITDNRGALTTVGAGMAAVGAVTTALSMKVIKTGVDFNNLEQTSRAALSSLLGSTQAANQQMEDLNDFVRKSPFGKDTFIEAQQQLLGFGIAANKAIPYLDAIQNAVAATGGSNQQILELSYIMGKISSSSKITAVDLMQFGKRGVDAAQVIGLAMGKTGGQIRADITSGALSADQALDALAQGMQMKFGGAAAAVKETFAGALQRVGAAFRDFSSNAMDPFVSKTGGGLFVDLLNGVADTIRALDKLPGPVKTAAVIVGTLGGASMTAGGALLMLAPRILDMVGAMSQLGAAGIPVISKFAAGWAAIPGHLRGVFPDLIGGFRSIGDSMTLASQMGVSKAQALKVGIGSAFQGIASSAKGVGSALLGAFGGLPGLAATAAIGAVTAAIMHNQQKAQAAASAAKEYAESLDEVTGAATAATRELLAMQALDGAGSDAWKNQGQDLSEYLDLLANDLPAAKRDLDAFEASVKDSLFWKPSDENAKVLGDKQRMYDQAVQGAKLLADKQDVLGKSAEGAAEGQDSLTGALDEGASSAKQYLAALQGLREEQDRQASAANDAIASERDWINARNALSESIAKNGTTLDQNTEAGQANMKAWQDLISASTSYVRSASEAGMSSDEIAARFNDADAAINSFAEQLGITSDEALEAAHNLGWLTDQDYELMIAMKVDGEAKIAELEAQLDGLPRTTVAQILAYGDEAEAVIEVVADALANNVPAETIAMILADGDDAITTAANVEAAVNEVKQHRPVDIEAINRANPEAAAADRAVNSPKQKSPIAINATDNATPVLASVKSWLDRIQSKRITLTTEHVQIGGNGTGTKATFATGGAIFGPGTATSDSIPAWLSNGEHVLTAREVMNLGGQSNVYTLRSLMRTRPQDLRHALGFADGGAVGFAPAPVPFTARSAAPVVNVAPMDLDGLRLVGDFRVNGQSATATDLRLERVSRGLTRLGDVARMQRH